MLVQLTQKVNEAVSRLNIEAAVPAFVSEWLRMRPEAETEIAKNVPGKNGSEREATLDGAFVSMAKGALGRIKKIPEMTGVMLERLQSGKTEPAIRCALAAILAYVVQPRDLIPDDAPGGYGLLDDAVMVHAGYLNVLALHPQPENVKPHEHYLRFLAGFMPREATAALQQTVQSLEMGLAFYRMLPVDMLEATTGILMANPLAPANAGSAQSGSSSVLLVSKVTPKYSYQKKSARVVVKFAGGGGVALDASGIHPLPHRAAPRPEAKAKAEAKPTKAEEPAKAEEPTKEPANAGTTS